MTNRHESTDKMNRLFVVLLVVLLLLHSHVVFLREVRSDVR